MSEQNGGLGRRSEAAYAASRAVVVKQNVGQSRRVRRNNLRVGRLEARAPKKLEAKLPASVGKGPVVVIDGLTGCDGEAA